MAWAQLRAKRGWHADTLVMLLEEFIRKEQLAARLLAHFATKGIR